RQRCELRLQEAASNAFAVGEFKLIGSGRGIAEEPESEGPSIALGEAPEGRDELLPVTMAPGEVEKAAVGRLDPQFAVVQAQDGRGDGKRVEQTDIVHSREVRSRIRSVRAAEPLGSRPAGRCSLHEGFYGGKELIPGIFSLCRRLLTAVGLPQLNRLLRGKPMGG